MSMAESYFGTHLCKLTTVSGTVGGQLRQVSLQYSFLSLGAVVSLFAAIILCVPSQYVFTAVPVTICHFLMNTAYSLSCTLQSRNLYWKCRECSKTAFCDNAMAKTLSVVLLIHTRGNFNRRLWTFRVPPCATQMKTRTKFQKSPIKTDEVPFQKLLSGQASHTEHAQFMPLLLSEKQKQQKFVVVKKAAVVPDLPYSLDFGECDIFLFAGIKWQLQW